MDFTERDVYVVAEREFFMDSLLVLARPDQRSKALAHARLVAEVLVGLATDTIGHLSWPWERD